VSARDHDSTPGGTSPDPGDSALPRLSLALENALLRALADAWDQLNFAHFRRQMRRPALTLHEGQRRLGLWNGSRRTLSVGRELVLQQPWATVIEVLKHEMAHQFVDEILGVTEETAHGPAFESVCRQRGFDASASGLPTPPGSAGSATEVETVLRRIGRLLALADSPNLNEAESAMREAQRLMLRHNLAATAASAQRGFAFRQLGTPRGRIEAAEQILGGILSDHFFVQVIWVMAYAPLEGRKGRVLEICGTAANLEVASWVHDYLRETSERLWREHKLGAGLTGDKERRRFRLGVMMGFHEKLGKAAADHRREGLVWTGDPALRDYLRARHPRQSTGRSIGFDASGVFEHGRRAGRDIVLRRPIHGHESRGRLLGRWQG
jgi:hypothetical protein